MVSKLVGYAGRLALLGGVLLGLNLLIIAVLSAGENGLQTQVGPTGGELIYAAGFLALLAKAAYGLLGRLRANAKLFRPSLTLAIVLTTSVISLLALDLFYPAPRDVPLFSALYFNPDLIAAGQLWRLLSVTLVHGSVMHLAFNISCVLIPPGK